MLASKLKVNSNSVKVLVLILISATLISCETVSYYTQAARGQLAIMLGREDIQRLLIDANLSADMRLKFNSVLEIREFAERELYLPVGDNYSSYVDIEREHVVWNVFAAPEFSTNPVNWCYPIAGCVAYRGYFSEAGADRFARRLEADGFDVYTGGIDAYSTLGWFDDSLLSTVLSRANYQLAALIFHELSHQIIYLPGDTTFNESFATTVERVGLRRWLQEINEAETIFTAEEDQARQQQFVDLVTSYRDKFDELYLQEMASARMRSRKTRLQDQLREDYEIVKRQWDGYQGYDSWFARSLNNAQLSTVSSYNDLVPFFVALLDQSAGDLRTFYQQVREIAELNDEERELRLAEFP